MEESEIFTRNMNNTSGKINIPLPYMQSGVYIMRLN